MPSVLAYWDTQVLAHPIRFLLNYVGEDFEDKHYSVKQSGTEFDKSDWLDKKFTLGLDFPNLPYYIDADVKITQSNTILRYIGRKYNMAGKTDIEKTRVDLALDQLLDTRWAMVLLCYFSPDFETEKADYIKALPDKLKLYDDFLRARQFVVGADVTIADFPMYAMLREHQLLAPACLKDFPKLQAYIDRFQNLPQIKRYMESDSYPKLPLYNKYAIFGNKHGY